MTPGARICFEDLVCFDRNKSYVSGLLVAGVDEAGRGALAGPVIAAAVICEPYDDLAEVRDSKLIRESVREELFELVIERCGAWSIGVIEPDSIDRINIFRATLEAMRRAIEGLRPKPSLVLVDGIHTPDVDITAEAVRGGDRKSFSIAAASIVAKVSRDRIMREMAGKYPGYGFTRNKGYGTREHIEAILREGPTPIHRRSFHVRADR